MKNSGETHGDEDRGRGIYRDKEKNMEVKVEMKEREERRQSHKWMKGINVKMKEMWK